MTCDSAPRLSESTRVESLRVLRVLAAIFTPSPVERHTTLIWSEFGEVSSPNLETHRLTKPRDVFIEGWRLASLSPWRTWSLSMWVWLSGAFQDRCCWLNFSTRPTRHPSSQILEHRGGVPNLRFLCLGNLFDSTIENLLLGSGQITLLSGLILLSWPRSERPTASSTPQVEEWIVDDLNNLQAPSARVEECLTLGVKGHFEPVRHARKSRCGILETHQARGFRRSGLRSLSRSNMLDRRKRATQVEGEATEKFADSLDRSALRCAKGGLSQL